MKHARPFDQMVCGRAGICRVGPFGSDPALLLEKRGCLRVYRTPKNKKRVGCNTGRDGPFSFVAPAPPGQLPTDRKEIAFVKRSTNFTAVSLSLNP